MATPVVVEPGKSATRRRPLNEKQKAALRKGHRWQPGQSGNPSGRPKGFPEVEALCRKHSPDAVAALVQIAQNEEYSAAARVAACQAILDRAWGRPRQSLDVQGNIDLNAQYLIALKQVNEKVKEGARREEICDSKALPAQAK